jgi:hypothetical protein
MPLCDGGFSVTPLLILMNKAIEKGKAYCTAIMKDYEEIQGSDDMKVIRDVPNLEAFGATNVVIRNITEDFWDKIIKLTETKGQRYRVCAVGTPGIGKTTATAVLIRKLLLMNRTVVFRIRTEKKDGWVYEFTPVLATEEGTIDVKVNEIQEKDFENFTMVSINYFKGEEDAPQNTMWLIPEKQKIAALQIALSRGGLFLFHHLTKVIGEDERFKHALVSQGANFVTFQCGTCRSCRMPVHISTTIFLLMQ